MSLEENLKELKRINEELDEMELEKAEIYVNGSAYVPSGGTEAGFYADCEPVGNPFAPFPYARMSGARKLREEIIEPKNI